MAKWSLKVKVPCPECGGTKIHDDNIEDWYVCPSCKGEGKVLGEVEPKEVEAYLKSRPEREDFECVGCGLSESILRPSIHQLPHGWLNWGGDILCNKCKTKVVYAALLAANQRVQKMKVDKSTKEKA